MDVRCERCDTEYELDDGAIPPGGCPVQCTNCGHTFMVAPGGEAAGAPAPGVESPPPAADWLLETADGKLHRFRNLTSLQKWIIERKVTREDKISRTGHAWRRLGEIVELGPFFDVVDEADRARAVQLSSAVAGSAPGRGSAARTMSGRSVSPAPTPASTLTGRPAPGYLPSPVPERPRGRSGSPVADHEPTPPPRAAHTSPPPERDSPEAVVGRDDRFDDMTGEFSERIDTSVVPARSHTGIKVLVVLLIAGAVGAGAIHWSRRHAGPAPRAQPEPTPPPVAEPTRPPAPVEAVVTSPAPQETAVAAVDPAPPAAAPPPTEGPPPSAALPSGAAGPGKGDAPAEPLSYDRLLEQADRVLENGGTERAFKLYERALALRPEGVDALVGLGYVMMDKGRNALAIGYFNRALGISPAYGPALFGLGEAARAAGNDAEALRAYRRYVEVSPTGRYAIAARRQIQALQGGEAPGE